MYETKKQNKKHDEGDVSVRDWTYCNRVCRCQNNLELLSELLALHSVRVKLLWKSGAAKVWAAAGVIDTCASRQTDRYAGFMVARLPRSIHSTCLAQDSYTVWQSDILQSDSLTVSYIRVWQSDILQSDCLTVSYIRVWQSDILQSDSLI